MIRQGAGELDLAAIAADAALLDQLAARTETPSDDPVARMLAAFAAEVDDGLAALLAPDPVEDAALAAVPAVSVVPALAPVSVRRGHGLRTTTVALVVGATLSVSGVAAAVTGDPFAPYRGIVSAVTGGVDGADAQAARVAWLQRQLAGTRAKVARGDLEGVEADLAQMRARLATTDDLSHGQRTALEARIGALDAALARAQDRAQDTKKEHGTPGAGPAVTPGPNSTKTPEPQNTKAPEPQNTKAPGGPQDTKAPEPQDTKVPEPQDTKKATPTSTAASGPASSPAPTPQDTKVATPQNTKKATPQNTKKATPLVSTTAVSADADESSKTDSHGPAKSERPAR